ncbi:hypothetical protein GCM10011374_35620 [Kocuria dechangensis]|uniref:Uncharacterized protein n=1 Tax=Kocuria dechangensis TaxID=1176249 RepID=A0A917H506_9MICC|nr:hypothetical protein [Kocuria dechangensis]GGG68167.1 hypothetical protein GCM10011374_35620 [Kocuria dechangensis]
MYQTVYVAARDAGRLDEETEFDLDTVINQVTAAEEKLVLATSLGADNV